MSDLQSSVFIENSHAFNYNIFSSQGKLCHLENINIIYNLFTSLFHRHFLLLANFPLFSRKKKKNHFHRLSDIEFIQQVKSSKRDLRSILDTCVSSLLTLNPYIFILRDFPVNNIVSLCLALHSEFFFLNKLGLF